MEIGVWNGRVVVESVALFKKVNQLLNGVGAYSLCAIRIKSDEFYLLFAVGKYAWGNEDALCCLLSLEFFEMTCYRPYFHHGLCPACGHSYLDEYAALLLKTLNVAFVATCR